MISAAIPTAPAIAAAMLTALRLPLGDREQRDQRAEARVERLAGEQPLREQRAERDDEHGDGRDPARDQRHGLEQDEDEADGLDRAEVAGPAGDRDQRQQRQAGGDERVNEERMLLEERPDATAGARRTSLAMATA